MDMSRRAPIVHIGLPKTATTSLQRHVFPHIPELRTDIKYNERFIIHALRGPLQHDTSRAEELDFRDSVNSGGHFISLEHLVGWSPRNWEEAADRNLRLFGRDATVIVSVRGTEAYLTSVYQQMIHQKNICKPEDFFLSGGKYDAVLPFIAPAILSRFDVDSFDLTYLHKLYSARFERCFFIPFDRIDNLKFLEEIFDLSDVELQYLADKLKRGRKVNRGYSATAMALTFKREDALRATGLMSLGSDYSAIELARQYSKQSEMNSVRVSAPTLFQKILFFPRRLLQRAIRWTTWRYWMQNVVDNVIPYRKYQLPDGVYRNGVLAAKNDEFVKSLKG